MSEIPGRPSLQHVDLGDRHIGLARVLVSRYEKTASGNVRFFSGPRDQRANYTITYVVEDN